MKPFDVLDPDQSIQQNWLLEASAGSGKTFAIENIYTRLLQETGVELDQILVVTFTRAAVSDLKARIKANLESKGLKHALLQFDSCQIFTIHSFCSRMLSKWLFEADAALSQTEEEAMLTKEEIKEIIFDFFRSGIGPKQFTQAELSLVLDQHGHSMEQLVSSLENLIVKGIDIDPGPTLEQKLKKLYQARGELKYSGQMILDLFDRLAPHFRGIHNRQKQVKEEIKEGIERFATLFDQKEWGVEEYHQFLKEQLLWVEIFDPKNVLKKGTPPPHTFREELMERLAPLISPHLIFARMAAKCQHLLRHRCLSQEKSSYDDLLKTMRKALFSETFRKSVQESFSFVLIDEFQDTDPVQWDIFRQIFTKKAGFSGHLTLVGDPKQSIYAFRQADIYTYLDAAAEFEESEKGSLNVNWRSTPSLVKGLNALFGAKACENLFTLPKKNQSIRYIEAFPAPNIEESVKTPIHFFYHQEEAELLPFISGEILRHHQEGACFQSFAVLVADRFQGRRVKEALDALNIPCQPQRGNPLTETSAYRTFCALLEAILYPKDESRGEIAALLLDIPYTELLPLLLNLHIAWIEDGFPALVRELLKMDQIEARQFYPLIDHLMIYSYTPEQLILHLYKLKEDPPEEQTDPNQDAVTILTIHSSKGLEFETVFTLGLIKRNSAPPLFIPDGETLRAAPDKNDPQYRTYCQEVDAEKMRQLYVAMTRAKKRLFCPILFRKGKEPPFGTASPMELFLAHFGENPLDFLKSIDEITVTDLNKYTAEQTELKLPADNEPIKKNSAIRSYPKIHVHSFSSLAQELSHTSEIVPPMDFEAEEKKAQTVPAGPLTGTLLHEILENIENQLPKSEISNFVTSYLKNTPFAAWNAPITQMVEDALYTPHFGSFSLSDVSPKQLTTELQFLYPKDKRSYLKGFIDLLFEKEGKIYLVDWKSNWLPDYTQHSMDLAMRMHQYHLQAEIYLEAARRYFNQFGQYEIVGAYYIFLRGGKSGAYLI